MLWFLSERNRLVRLGNNETFKTGPFVFNYHYPHGIIRSCFYFEIEFPYAIGCPPTDENLRLFLRFHADGCPNNRVIRSRKLDHPEKIDWPWKEAIGVDGIKGINGINGNDDCLTFEKIYYFLRDIN